MKFPIRIKQIIVGLACVAMFQACIKNDDIVIAQEVIEFDAATYNANSAGVTYPVLTRVAGYGRAVNTSTDPLITRTSGTINLRVNLVAAPKSTDQTFAVAVVAAGSTAVAGTHYTALAGTVVIPKDSSFGYVPVQILNPGPATTGPVRLVLQLTGTAAIKANPNENTIGLNIAQN